MPRHAKSRLAVMSQAKSLVRIRRCGSGDRVRRLLCLGLFGKVGLLLLLLLDVLTEGEEVIRVPGYFGLTHPKRVQCDLVLRPFVVSAAWLIVWAAHNERSAGNWHEVKLDVGSGNCLNVGGQFLWCRNSSGFQGVDVVTVHP